MGKVGFFFKSKPVTGTFAGLALLGGLAFSDISFTGSAINGTPTINALSLIGLALAVCSLLLAYHTIKN